MSTPATGSSTSAPTGSSATGFVMVARLTLVLIAVQFALAGLGAFHGLGGGDLEGGLWQPHNVLGYGIGLLTLVLLLLALGQRLGHGVVRWTAVVAGLTLIGQPVLSMLGEDVSVWFGPLHALNAVVIAAVLGIVSARLGRSGAQGVGQR